jgi:hypothetical protein
VDGRQQAQGAWLVGPAQQGDAARLGDLVIDARHAHVGGEERPPGGAGVQGIGRDHVDVRGP